MAREQKCYRENLEDILCFFEGRRILSISDVCRYTGRGYRWVKSSYPFQGNSITAMALAKAMA